MLSFKALINRRFGYVTLLGAMVLGALIVIVIWQRQPPPPVDPKLVILKENNQTLTNALAKANMTLDIEREIVIEMNNTLLSLQAESLEQQLALRFYQKVMAPEYTANGVHIEKVILESGVTNRFVRFEILIAQLEKRKRYIKGAVELEVSGSLDGKPQILNISSMVKAKKDLKVSFRFFQHIKSEFELPPNFIPQRVKVIIKMPRQRGQKAADVSQEYAWQALIKSPIIPMLPSS